VCSAYLFPLYGSLVVRLPGEVPNHVRNFHMRAVPTCFPCMTVWCSAYLNPLYGSLVVRHPGEVPNHVRKVHMRAVLTCSPCMAVGLSDSLVKYLIMRHLLVSACSAYLFPLYGSLVVWLPDEVLSRGQARQDHLGEGNHAQNHQHQHLHQPVISKLANHSPAPLCRQ
jgi:hypothetical protein